MSIPDAPILDVRDLDVVYDGQARRVHAIQDANLSVKPGEAVGLAGESGSGKSTLARAALGLLPPGESRITGGSLAIAGSDVTHYTPRQWERVRGRPLAIVFQDP